VLKRVLWHCGQRSTYMNMQFEIEKDWVQGSQIRSCVIDYIDYQNVRLTWLKVMCNICCFSQPRWTSNRYCSYSMFIVGYLYHWGGAWEWSVTPLRKGAIHTLSKNWRNAGDWPESELVPGPRPCLLQLQVFACWPALCAFKVEIQTQTKSAWSALATMILHTH
jgi:hypothetical protein